MMTSTKEILRTMAIQVSMLREVGRSAMAVEFFTSRTSMLAPCFLVIVPKLMLIVHFRGLSVFSFIFFLLKYLT